MIKTYKQLILLSTFEQRFDYLKIGKTVGRSTFGFDRYLNQAFYNSREWKDTRDRVIVRDNGCDLGISDREIFGQILIHHINPITIEDIEDSDDIIFDMNNLICTTHDTHNAIHYGNKSLLSELPRERTKGDMCPWRKI